MRASILRSILFVCTGNTCRSPLAAALARQKLAERLRCAVAELPARGFGVQSAGLLAGYGDAASRPMMAVAQTLGLDLSEHRSRPVNPELLAATHDVLAMTDGHAALLRLRYPDLIARVQLLGGPGGDVPDPIGGDGATYLASARVIAGHLDRHLAEWLGS